MPTTARQAAAYYARKRRRGRADPIAELFATLNLGVAAASVDTNAVFPDRTRPLTFATAILVTGASAAGIIFEFGDDTTGTKLAVSGGSIYAAAGGASEAADTGVAGDAALAALGVAGSRLALVLAIKPAQGQARLWVNGALTLRMNAPSDTAMLGGVWTSTNAGAVGAAHAGGASTQRNGVAINGAPTDFSLVEPVRVAVGMTPRQFD